VYLVRHGEVPFVVAGEVNEGPYMAAKTQVAAAELGALIDVRRGDGLAVLRPGEVDCVVIAGMGGSLITNILTRGEQVLSGVSLGEGEICESGRVQTLVLQPNIGEDVVRQWLAANDYVLRGERLVEEDGIIYEILYAEHGEEAGVQYRSDLPAFAQLSAEAQERWLYRLGPYLASGRSELFLRKWYAELTKMERIYGQLQHSQSPQATAKAERIRRDIVELTSILEAE
jgi:tRNA (adenine22-N1)-methyltransferase